MITFVQIPQFEEASVTPRKFANLFGFADIKKSFEYTVHEKCSRKPADVQLNTAIDRGSYISFVDLRQACNQSPWLISN